jgi:phosphatidylserine decarboxylase
MFKNILDICFIILQVILPKHFLSRIIAVAADSENFFIKKALINLAINAFNININEAISQKPEDYKNFNDFFMRELKSDARTFDADTNKVISPCDGEVSQCGKIENGVLIQAKGKYFDLKTLLGGDDIIADKFINGHFATIYLSPKDYHRVHMPCDGKLSNSIYVPGELFSVNQTTAKHIQGLFARNERLVNIFETANGPMASIMIGAMLVAGIETVWSGQVVPPKNAISTFNKHEQENIELKRSEEMGRFKFGSTVILLFPENTITWQDDFTSGKIVKLGEAIGEYCS